MLSVRPLSGGGQEVQAQALSERALVPRSVYIFGVQPNGVQVDPHLGFLRSPRGQCFLSGGQSGCCIVVLDCQTGGLVGQYSEDGSLRSQARPRFLGEDMEAQSRDLNRDLVHLMSERGSDDHSGWAFCP